MMCLGAVFVVLSEVFVDLWMIFWAGLILGVVLVSVLVAIPREELGATVVCLGAVLCGCYFLCLF